MPLFFNLSLSSYKLGACHDLICTLNKCMLMHVHEIWLLLGNHEMMGNFYFIFCALIFSRYSAMAKVSFVVKIRNTLNMYFLNEKANEANGKSSRQLKWVKCK